MLHSDENSKQSADILDEVHYSQSSPESVTVKSEHSSSSASTEQQASAVQAAAQVHHSPQQLYHQPYQPILPHEQMIPNFEHAHFQQGMF